MIQSMLHIKHLKKLQTLFVCALLVLQSAGAALASQHAANGNSEYLCGNGYVPASAVANIKALLAQQGDPADEQSLDCDVCCTAALAEFSDDQSTYTSRYQVNSFQFNNITRLLSFKKHPAAPVGLRAPPISFLK